jgi:hypothetical protein
MRDAIRRGRGRLGFHRAAPVTEFVLANIATRLGQPLEFDPVTGRIYEQRRGRSLIHPPRREGWAL